MFYDHFSARSLLAKDIYDEKKIFYKCERPWTTCAYDCHNKKYII